MRKAVNSKRFFSCNHGYKKYLIVGLSLYKCGLGDNTTTLISSISVILKYDLKLERLVYVTALIKTSYYSRIILNYFSTLLFLKLFQHNRRMLNSTCTHINEVLYCVTYICTTILRTLTGKVRACTTLAYSY